MSTLFISDLHLEETRPEITAAFHRFVREQASQADTLYILGDFFEAWIGDDEHTPLQDDVAETLRQLTAGGTRLFLMHGNRDFLLGNDLCERVGGTLLDDPTVVDLYGEPTLLMHGDSLCIADIEYQKFRKNMRNPEWQQAFLKRPLADRQQVARQLRQISMARNQGKQESIMDVTPEEVVRQMSEYGVRQLIHGHTHRPAIHDLEADGASAQRIVLGDWDKAVWFVRAEAGRKPELLEQPF
jgi:UDP-2,3-diacylglucosamine hydrolase